MRAAFDAFAASDIASLNRAELMAVMDEYEALTCQLPAPWHRMLCQLQAEATPKELGANHGTRRSASGGDCRPGKPAAGWPRPTSWHRGAF